MSAPLPMNAMVPLRTPSGGESFIRPEENDSYYLQPTPPMAAPGRISAGKRQYANEHDSGMLHLRPAVGYLA